MWHSAIYNRKETLNLLKDSDCPNCLLQKENGICKPSLEDQVAEMAVNGGL